MDIRTNHHEPTDPVETDQTGLMIMTFVEYLQAQRTLDQEQVDKITREHDAEDFKPSERVNFETGSIRKVQR